MARKTEYRWTCPLCGATYWLDKPPNSHDYPRQHVQTLHNAGPSTIDGSWKKLKRAR